MSQTTSAPRLSVRHLIWAAATFSVFLYAGVSFVLRDPERTGPELRLTAVFGAVAFGAFGLGLLLALKVAGASRRAGALRRALGLEVAGFAQLELVAILGLVLGLLGLRLEIAAGFWLAALVGFALCFPEGLSGGSPARAGARLTGAGTRMRDV